MKKKFIDKEEQEIIEAYERGEFKKARNSEQLINRMVTSAVTHTKKQARINIRMANGDLNALKNLAEEEGLPYQTLISSVLHKYVNGRLVPATRR
jgi:predicted DNA binding CopG/RHH family protein